MAITTAICNSFKKEILEGVHESTDTYKVALYTDAATLSASTTAYSSTNEVAKGLTVQNVSAQVISLQAGLNISSIQARGVLDIEDEEVLLLLVA